MHRITRKFMSFFKRQVRPSLCADCKVTMDRKFGLKGKISHRIKHRKHGKGHKLHGAAKKAFLRRMAAGRRKARR